MSYNVPICTPPVPAEDNAAWEVLDSLINEQGAPPPVLRELQPLHLRRYRFGKGCGKIGARRPLDSLE